MEELLKAVKEAQAAMAALALKGDEQAKAYESKFADLVKKLEEMETAGKATRTELNDALKQIAVLMNPNRPGVNENVGKALGDILVESESFKQADWGNAKANAKAQVGFLLKSILTGATGIPDKTRLAGIMPIVPDWSSWLFNRVAQGTMTGGVFEWVQDTSPAYDQTVPPTAEGALKPEVTNTFELKSVAPKTIAHWLSASKQILADMAALGSFLNARLLYGLVRKLEYQVVNGSGVGTNLQGLMTVAPDAGVVIAGDTPFDTVRKAIGVVEANAWNVDTVGLHPLDWALLQIIKGTDGHYVYFNPASSVSVAPIWGKPVVASPEVQQGKFLLGAFQQGAQLLEREGASVQAGFQNDDFTRNLVTLLAEMRAVQAIYAINAFRKGNLY